MKCAKCKKDLIKEGGYYVTAEGDFCSRCYGLKSRKMKIDPEKKPKIKNQKQEM